MNRSPTNPIVIPAATHRLNGAEGDSRLNTYQLQPAATSTADDAMRVQVGIRRSPSPSTNPPNSSAAHSASSAASQIRCQLASCPQIAICTPFSLLRTLIASAIVTESVQKRH